MRAQDFRYFAQPFTALAHRGGSLGPGNQGRENTLQAFRNAVDLGYTHVETDVHVTRDGVLVAFHDDVLDRVSDQTGAIAEATWAEVSRARIGGEPVPRLDEVLEELPTTCFNIDIKAPGAVEPLAHALALHGAEGRVCVGSFSERRIRRFRRLTGNRVPTAVGPVGVALASRLGLPHALQDAGVAFQMPVSHPVAGKDMRLLTRILLDQAHQHGKVVHVWTVNEADQMHELIELGVDGIVTDATDVLRDVLLERGLWPSSSPRIGEQSESSNR